MKINIEKYFEYYVNHTRYVVLAWKDIQEILIKYRMITEEEFHKISQLIIWHDNSKIDKEEFSAYAAKYFPINSDNQENLESINEEFKKAWFHHKEHNIHHHQTLKDYRGTDWKCYVVEMICDWIAFGWQHGTFVQEYYEQNKDKLQLPIEYKKLLEEVLSLIAFYPCYANGPIDHHQESELTFR